MDEPRPHPLIETETEIDAVALSSDGSDAFVLEASGQLTALDLESRSERWSSMAHPEISVDEFDYGEVVNVFSGESQGPVPAAAAALDRRPQRLAVSADGSRIVSAEHVSIRTWDTATGDLVGDQLSVVRTDEGARTLTPVDELAISRDGQRVAWAFRNTVAVAAVGAELAERGDAPATSGTSVGRPKIDGLWFVDTHLRVLFTDGRTALFDPDSQAVTDPTSTASPGRVGDVAIDPSGRRAVFAADQGVSVHALDGDRLLADAVPREATHHAGGVHPDLDLVILSSSNSINFDQGPGALWDVSDPVPRPLRYPDTERTEVVMHFSPDGRFLASMTNSFEYSIWDPATLERIATYPMPGSWISHDWSDDGRFFAAGTLAGLEIFDAVEGASLRVLDALGPYPGSVGFDAGSGRLLGATSNGQAAGWSTDTWEPLDASALDGTRILAFSPNGRWLVTVDQDGSLFVRDPSDFSVERVLPANLAVSFQFVMSFVDDRYLVVFDEEGAELWNIESGVRVGDPFPNDPDFLAFRADSGPLLTAEGPWALLWNLDTAEWFDIACQAAGRNTGGSAGHVDRLGSQTAQEVVTRRAAALRK